MNDRFFYPSGRSIRCLLALTVLWFAADKPNASAQDSPRPLTPEEQIEVIEKTIEKNRSEELAPTRHKVTGKFVDPEGAGKEGYCVFMSRKHSSGIHASTRVTKNGTFERIATGPALVIIIPRFKGFSQKHFGPYEMSEETLDLGVLKLDEGFSANILVQDENGKPIPNAEVQSVTVQLNIGGRSMSYAADQLRGTVSDEAGLLRLQHLSELPMRFDIRVKGYEYDRKVFTFREGETLDWKLKPIEPVTGQIVDASGKGVEGVEIIRARQEGFAESMDDPRPDFVNHLAGRFRYQKPVAVTDQDGRFAIESLRTDSKYWFMTLHKDFRPKLLPAVSAGESLEPQSLEEPLTVKGVVKGDRSVLRRYGDETHLSYRNPISIGGQDYHSSFSTVVDADGKFTMTQLVPGPFEDLHQRPQDGIQFDQVDR